MVPQLGNDGARSCSRLRLLRISGGFVENRIECFRERVQRLRETEEVRRARKAPAALPEGDHRKRAAYALGELSLVQAPLDSVIPDAVRVPGWSLGRTGCALEVHPYGIQTRRKTEQGG